MIPETLILPDELQPQSMVMPSLSYKLDFDTGNISLLALDDVNSLLQSIEKILKTDRYAYVIYDGNYGNELHLLKGQSIEYAIAEIPRLVKEALLGDDRITSIENFKFNRAEFATLKVEFTAYTVFGDINYEMGVRT